MPNHDNRFDAAAGARVVERVSDERRSTNRNQRFRDAVTIDEPRSVAGGENDCLKDRRGRVGREHAFPILADGAHEYIRVTFPGLAETTDPAPAAVARGARTARSPEQFEHDTIDILKRLSRKPIDPTPDSELMADLGFDSLQVLELVGELEDHFNIAVPLNALTHIRTVRQIAEEARRLVDREGRP
jgi:acyl carrier protein